MSPMINDPVFGDPMNPESGNSYGATVTKRGRALIAKILAEKMPLTITRTMVGSGSVPGGMFAGDLEDLVEPVAAATSNEPVYDGDTVHMTIEYRSDLNGGLDHGFWIREYAVYAKDLDGGEVMLYYGTLGDYPQWVSAYSKTGIDTRRFPISITVGEGATVIIDYSPEEAQKLIDEHNGDMEAHPFLQNLNAAIDSRLSLLELMYNTDVSGNPFSVTFDSLTGLVVTGVWNTSQQRLEF